MKALFYEVDADQTKFFTEKLKDVDVLSFQTALPSTIPNDAKNAEILSVFINSHVTKQILPQLPNIKLIVTRSTGYDHIDVQACKEQNIIVRNLPDYSSTAVAEYTFALLLQLIRHICSTENIRGVELANKKLGIIGTGTIGKKVARIAHGFNMNLCAVDICKDEECVTNYEVEYCSFDQLCTTANIITLHIPLLPNTRHIINHKAIKLMQPGTLLINTARGELIDNDALLFGLENNIIAGAALDVVEKHNDSLITSQPKVITTPHNAYNTYESFQRMMKQTTDIIQNFIHNKLE